MVARWHQASFGLLNGTLLVALSILSALRRSQEALGMDNDLSIPSVSRGEIGHFRFQTSCDTDEAAPSSVSRKGGRRRPPRYPILNANKILVNAKQEV